LFFLPGVPDEMKEMLRDFVLPTLQERFPQQVLSSRLLRIFGLRESEIGHLLAGLTEQYPTVNLGYLPSFPEHRLSLTVKADTLSAAEKTLTEVHAEVMQRLGNCVYGQGEETLETVVGRLFTEKGYTLALAESCTGGLIADLITNFPGSSAFFDRAMVTYSDIAKIAHLRVPAEIISRSGSASAEVAEAMVRGLREQHEFSMALAVTGVAGPAGSTATLPVGTVFLALLCHDAFRVERFRFGGSRREIKIAAAYTALDWLRRAMIDDSFFAGDSPP
jgi:nicotinamide-nucleotide amidase